MNWRSPVVMGPNQFLLPKSWLHIHYFEAFNTLFRIENSLRLLVYCILKKQYLDKWDDVEINIDVTRTKRISEITKSRINKVKDYSHLSHPVTNPLMYLTLGDLIKIVLSDQNWPLFQKYFPAKLDILKFKLDEITYIRNALSHFRPISNDDSEAIKIISKQIFFNIEMFLSGILNPQRLIPSNSDEEYIKHLRQELLNKQSPLISTMTITDDGDWITLGVLAPIPELTSNNFNNNIISKHANINIYKLLKSSQPLRKFITFIDEWLPTPIVENDKIANIFKTFNFVFAKSCLKLHYKEITQILSNINDIYAKDLNAISNDFNYSGDFIEYVDIYAMSANNYIINPDKLTNYIFDEEFPEYWGKKNLVINDFISDIFKYPWMPTDISSPYTS